MTVTELMLQDLATHIWGERPSLRLILSHNDGSPRMGELDLVPTQFWMRRACVTDTLEALLAVMQANETPAIHWLFDMFGRGAGVHGISIFTETWMVRTSDDIPVAERDQLSAFKRDHRMHEYPGRVRSRILAASLADGSDLMVQQAFGKQPVTVAELAPRDVRVEAVTLDGATFEVLRRIRDYVCRLHEDPEGLPG